jgi:hypothetical protein
MGNRIVPAGVGLSSMADIGIHVSDGDGCAWNCGNGFYD